MRAAGIIAEYNPFHLGHALHIREIRRRLGDVAIVCAMSGNYVQRGECAVLDKWSRTECALLGGADLVLELPSAQAVSSAEGFARGGVELLAATGVVDFLSFGCEAENLASLEAAAACLDRPDVQAKLWERVEKGEFVAAARERTVRELVGDAADCLKSPNNNLAVEYLRAVRRAGAGLTPLAIPRRGAGHGSLEPEEGLASGEGVRALLRGGEWERAASFLPETTAVILRRERERGMAPASMAYCERAVLARLRGMTPEEFLPYPDNGYAEGLPHRLLRAAQAGESLEEVLALAKTKRYAHARLRRLVLRAFLDLGERAAPERPYLRVLGMSGRGRALLREMGKRENVLIKPTHVRRMSPQAQALFGQESRCTDLFGLCTPRIAPCGREWERGPVILAEERGEEP